MTESTFGGFNIKLGGAGDAGRPLDSSAPFRVLFLGDFSGRAAKGTLETGRVLGKRKIWAIDADDVSDVFETLDVSIPVRAAGAVLRIRDIEGFHPDQIFEAVPRFGDLKDAEDSARTRRSERRIPSGGFLDQILSGKPDLEAPKEPEPEAGETPTSLMRTILRDPAFRSVEMSWRSVDFLRRRLDLEEGPALYILDISLEEIRKDLETEDLQKTGLFEILVTRTVGTPGQHAWAIACLLETLGKDPADAELLAKLTMIASIARTSVLSGADSTLAGCPSFETHPSLEDWAEGPPREVRATWDAIRQMPESRYLGLVMPRLLLRLPYGKKSDSVDCFEFEEVDYPPQHEDLLWGPGSVAAACLIARAFQRDGWDLKPGSEQDLENLPFLTYKDKTETVAIPCAEAVLTVKAAERLIAMGFMPLLSMKGRDEARLGMTQSFTARPLAGPWRS
ncbi:MAG: type VI secretion system contractile sheath large subunit [Thermoanaerobaculia bacterium]|nr:type VI secretion system contractile sheath large subunit [Thermoanaerobaculia bacterium]